MQYTRTLIYIQVCENEETLKYNIKMCLAFDFQVVADMLKRF